MMKVSATAVLIAVLSLTVAVAADRGGRRTTPPAGVVVNEEKHTPDLAVAVRLGLEEANLLRAEAGRAALSLSPELATAAASFASFMAAADVLDHEADGSDPSSRARRAGYEPCMVAENLAYQYLSTGFSTQDLVQSFMGGWMDSPGHRANLLEPDVTETGFAIARSSQTGRYYAVQLFGRPRSLAVAFVLRNATRADLRYAIGDEVLSLPVGTTVRHQRCQPARLRFDWPGGQSPTTLDVRDGVRYSVMRSEAALFSIDEQAAE